MTQKCTWIVSQKRNLNIPLSAQIKWIKMKNLWHVHLYRKKTPRFKTKYFI